MWNPKKIQQFAKLILRPSCFLYSKLYAVQTLCNYNEYGFKHWSDYAIEKCVKQMRVCRIVAKKHKHRAIIWTGSDEAEKSWSDVVLWLTKCSFIQRSATTLLFRNRLFVHFAIFWFVCNRPKITASFHWKIISQESWNLDITSVRFSNMGDDLDYVASFVW